MADRTRSETRQRTVLLVTRCSPDEAGRVRRAAADCELSVSAYLRLMALAGVTSHG